MSTDIGVRQRASLGSREHAARLATGELARKGWPRLASLVGGHVASFGESCWQTYGRLSEVLRRPDGRRYHKESIARVTRELRDEGVITSERIFVNGKLPARAKHDRSSRGTTIKAFCWGAISQKNPFSKRERRILRQKQAIELRQEGELQKPPGPRHASARAIVDPVQMPEPIDAEAFGFDPELGRAIQRARQLNERAQGSESQRPPTSSAPERPPPE